MKSPGTHRLAFTFAEITIIIAIIAALAGLSAPFLLRSFDSARLNQAHSLALDLLRTAQLRAISSQGDAPYGVKINPGEMILFKGAGFEARDFGADETFGFDDDIQLSGQSELWFKKVSGTPQPVGESSITFSLRGQSRTISVEANGRISGE